MTQPSKVRPITPEGEFRNRRISIIENPNSIYYPYSNDTNLDARKKVLPPIRAHLIVRPPVGFDNSGFFGVETTKAEGQPPKFPNKTFYVDKAYSRIGNLKIFQKRESVSYDTRAKVSKFSNRKKATLYNDQEEALSGVPNGRVTPNEPSKKILGEVNQNNKQIGKAPEKKPEIGGLKNQLRESFSPKTIMPGSGFVANPSVTPFYVGEGPEMQWKGQENVETLIPVNHSIQAQFYERPKTPMRGASRCGSRAGRQRYTLPKEDEVSAYECIKSSIVKDESDSEGWIKL